MYMKVDYIRLYQDHGDDLEADNYMQIGCDPKSHPTKEWIEGHIDEYEDNDNKWKRVAGKAFCNTSDDCTIGGSLAKTALKTVYAAVMKDKKAASKKNEVKAAVELYSNESSTNAPHQVKSGSQESLRFMSNDLKPKDNYSQNFV
ncbi:Beta-glucan synthesis-associated protein [Phytophthora megakarya]|uniref:Beta-glucan synthesis-associated protein n=1 Tax=Phytophthora megakarya TaxID=4795 RepID=A0A225UL54_9STRA|nr:Beta-glucan synthesis-associated protein [Phytophthora megakarya]